MASRKKFSIRTSIERLLIPALEARGFTLHPHEHPSSLDPYGQFRRVGARGTDLCEISFDKNRPTCFSLHLSVQPPGWRAEPGTAMVVSNEWPTYYFSGRWLGFRVPFGVHRPGGQITAAEFDRAVQTVVDLLPEVDAFYESGASTPRMEHFPLRKPDRLASLFRALVLFVLFGVPAVLVLWLVGWLIRQ